MIVLLVFLVLFASGMLWFFKRKKSNARLIFFNTVSSAGKPAINIELYSECFGNKAHPAVLLISGAMASARFWPDTFCQEIANHGYFVIRYDHRDMGLSSAINYAKNPYVLHDLEGDALAILDAYNIKKAHVIGHSMGGAIAQLLALDYPDRVLSIVPISSVPIVQSQLYEDEKAFLEQTWQALMRNKPTKNFKESVDGFMNSYEYLHGTIPMDKELAKNFIYDMYARSRAEHIEWFEKFSRGVDPMHNHIKAQLAMPDRTEVLKKLSCPVLIIHGTKDCLALPRLMKEYCADLVPHTTMHEIDGMGHMILNQQLFARIAHLVVQFFRSNEA